MDKLLVFPGQTNKGVFNFLIDYDRTHLVKTASEYHPSIAAYINSAKKIPGKTQLLLTALGAGEYWGFNSNGDWFGEDQLAHEGTDYGFKTFEHYAKYYKHHVNKDPKRSYGDVLLAVYNPVYHRVELIVAIDHEKAPDIIEKIENGETVWHSMGCRIPYDICSICGNKAPSRKYYCEHLRFMLGQVDPGTGRAVYAINIKPKFFDISYVIIPADKTAMGLKKVASTFQLVDSCGKPIGSAEAAEKEAAQRKIADIIKEIPSEPPSSTDLVDNSVAKHVVRTVMETKDREQQLPKQVIDNLCSLGDLPKILSTLTACAILPKPQEFQRMFLISRGDRDLADKLDRMNVCFDPTSSGFGDSHLEEAGSNTPPSEELAEILLPYFEARSNTSPLIIKRMDLMIKRANEYPVTRPQYIEVSKGKDNSVLKTLAAGAAIYAALNYLNGGSVEKIISFIANNPKLSLFLTAGAASGIASSMHAQMRSDYKGRFSGTEAIVPETTNMYDRIERMRERPYLKTSAEKGTTGAVLRRLLIGVPAVHMVSGGLQKLHEADPQAEEGAVKGFIRKHPNLLGGIVVADALLAAHGKGSYRVTNPIAKAQSRWLKGEPLFKSAGVVEDGGFSSEVKSASISEYVNIPDGVFGSLFDQTILELGSKLIS